MQSSLVCRAKATHRAAPFTALIFAISACCIKTSRGISGLARWFVTRPLLPMSSIFSESSTFTLILSRAYGSLMTLEPVMNNPCAPIIPVLSAIASSKAVVVSHPMLVVWLWTSTLSTTLVTAGHGRGVSPFSPQQLHGL